MKQTKICTKCGETKNIDEFYKNKRGLYGVRADCKVCQSQAQKGWRKKNPEYHREWENKKRPPGSEARREKDRKQGLRRNFKMTTEQYDQMLADQGHVCLICGASSSSFNRRLAVDHCHKTGKIRGLLCHLCNTALGVVERVGSQAFDTYLGEYTCK